MTLSTHILNMVRLALSTSHCCSYHSITASHLTKLLKMF